MTMPRATHLAWAVPATVIIGGAVLTGYINIITSLGQINRDIVSAVGVLTARVSVDEQRISDDEKLIEETRQDQRDFATELRQAIEAGVKAGRH